MNNEIKEIMNKLNIWEKINYNNVIWELYNEYDDENFINYFKEIDYYLLKTYETPLLLTLNDKIDSGLFFSKWKKFHENKTNDIIIPVFGSYNDKNRNLYEILYLVLIELREHFNISQKVNFIENKIRKDFDYWIEIVSKKINKKPNFKDNVILIFESVHLYNENEINLKEFLIKYWIPKKKLDRFKIIITCDKNSLNYKYCNEINIKQINITTNVLENKINNHINNSLYNLYKKSQKLNYLSKVYFYLTKKDYVFSNQNEGENYIKNILLTKFNFYFVISFLDFIFPLKGDFCSNILFYFENKLFLTFENNDSIYKDILKFCSINILNNVNIKNLEKTSKNNLLNSLKNYLIITTLTSKGLNIKEILSFLSIKEKTLINIQYLFSNSIKEFNGYYKNINLDLINFVNTNLLENNKMKLEFHSKIGNCIDLTSNSIRKIEEQTFHYLISKEYFILKQTICNIENFMWLYNSKSKFKLFKFWQSLIMQNYDPVIEYDKSIELFEMHFQTQGNSLFKIIIQISRFFKEFSEFEFNEIPEFKHPLIKNKILSIHNNEKIKLKTISSSWDNKTKINMDFNFNNNNKKESLWDNDKSIEVDRNFDINDPEIEQHKKGIKKNYLYSIGVLKEFKKYNLYDNNDNDSNLKEIENYKNLNKNISNESEINDSTENQNIKKNKEFDFESTKKKLLNNIENYNNINNDKLNKNKNKEKIKNNSEQNYYYYKRWLWLIFPWVSLSWDTGCNFSDVMSKTGNNDIYYLSVDEEIKLTQQVQKLIIESKIKKQLLLKSKNNNLIGLKLLKEQKPKNLICNINQIKENKKNLFNYFKNNIKNEFNKWKKNQLNEEKNIVYINKQEKNSDKNWKNNFFITSINDDNFENKQIEKKFRKTNFNFYNKESIKILNKTNKNL